MDLKTVLPKSSILSRLETSWSCLFLVCHKSVAILFKNCPFLQDSPKFDFSNGFTSLSLSGPAISLTQLLQVNIVLVPCLVNVNVL